MRGGWPADYAATDMLAAVQVIVLVYPAPFVTKVLLDALLLHWPGECGARERRYERGFQVFLFLTWGVRPGRNELYEPNCHVSCVEVCAPDKFLVCKVVQQYPLSFGVYWPDEMYEGSSSSASSWVRLVVYTGRVVDHVFLVVRSIIW